MADSEKVVIKINYQDKGKTLKSHSKPEMVTEWHVQRILVALALLMIFILFPFFYFSSEPLVSEKQIEQKTVVSEPIILEDAKLTGKIIKKEADNPETVLLKKVKQTNLPDQESLSSLISIEPGIVRALLTMALSNKEPVGRIVSPLKVNKNKAVGPYYFTEIIDMKGKYLFHQWLRDDEIIFNRKLNILGNRWRASTSKLISYSKAGDWKVRLVNEEGDILNEIEFSVIQE